MIVHLKAACPECHQNIEVGVDDDRPVSKVMWVTCGRCGSKDKWSAFEKEHRRQQKQRDRVAQEEERARQRLAKERRQRAREERRRMEARDAAERQEAEQRCQEAEQRRQEAERAEQQRRQEAVSAEQQRRELLDKRAAEAAPPNYLQHQQILAELSQVSETQKEQVSMLKRANDALAAIRGMLIFFTVLTILGMFIWLVIAIESCTPRYSY